jgi:hypothetical protein
MKFAQVIQDMKSKMAVVGLGATLLFANACYAQQETNPDNFDMNPGTATQIGVTALPANDGAFTVESQPVQVAEVQEPAAAEVVEGFDDGQFGLLDSGVAIAIAAGLTFFGVCSLLLASLKKNKKSSAATSDRSRLQRTTPRPAI